MPENNAGNQGSPCIVGAVLIGYARVSTAEQNPAHQVDALARAGVAAGEIYVDTASGTKLSMPTVYGYLVPAASKVKTAS